jgi:hypothetical protein
MFAFVKSEFRNGDFLGPLESFMQEGIERETVFFRSDIVRLGKVDRINFSGIDKCF